MKELIPKDEYGIFCDSKDTMRIDSRDVAIVFEKQHKNVIQSIENLDCSEEFNRLNFQPVKYKDAKGEQRKAYAMTRDGFTFLVMGFTGKKAAQFKEEYIKRFNEMEKVISDLVTARVQFPRLTAQIKRIHENPKPYHYSNECDMINRLVTGMSAKQIREKNGLQKGESIRPYLTAEQIAEMEELQFIDGGLLVAVTEFEKRKQMLTAELERIRSENN